MQVSWHPTPAAAALAAGWRGPHQLHGHEEVMRLVEQEELEPERNRHRPQHRVDAAPCEVGWRNRRDGRHQLGAERREQPGDRPERQRRPSRPLRVVLGAITRESRLRLGEDTPQALARDLASDGIRVNAIAPGVIETPMTASTREDPNRLAGFMTRTPLGRVGQPDELIGPVIFLASSMASYVSGAILPVDGGFLAA